MFVRLGKIMLLAAAPTVLAGTREWWSEEEARRYHSDGGTTEKKRVAMCSGEGRTAGRALRDLANYVLKQEAEA